MGTQFITQKKKHTHTRGKKNSRTVNTTHKHTHTHTHTHTPCLEDVHFVTATFVHAYWISTALDHHATFSNTYMPLHRWLFFIYLFISFFFSFFFCSQKGEEGNTLPISFNWQFFSPPVFSRFFENTTITTYYCFCIRWDYEEIVLKKIMKFSSHTHTNFKKKKQKPRSLALSADLNFLDDRELDSFFFFLSLKE